MSVESYTSMDRAVGTYPLDRLYTCKRCEGKGYTQEVIFDFNKTEKFICVTCNGRGLITNSVQILPTDEHIKK